MYVTLICIETVTANISKYSIAYAIANGMATEPPMRIQAEFVIFDRIADNSGRIRHKHQLPTKVPMHCVFVNPNGWNCLYTKHINLSTAISIVNAFDIEVEYIKMTPATLHIADFFQCRATYGTFPRCRWWETIVRNRYIDIRPSATFKFIIRSGEAFVFAL